MANSSPITKISQYFPLIEGVCLASFAIGYLLKYMDVASGQEIIILSLGALSGIYYLNGFIPRALPKAPEAQIQPLGFTTLPGKTIIPKILAIGSSVTVIGILFTIQHWHGLREMLLIGSTSLAAASVTGLIITMNDEQARNAIGPKLLRAIPLMLAGVYLLIIHGLSVPAT